MTMTERKELTKLRRTPAAQRLVDAGGAVERARSELATAERRRREAILAARKGSGRMTLETIGSLVGLTAGRVKQIVDDSR